MFNLLLTFRPISYQILGENTKTPVLAYLLINEKLYFISGYYYSDYCGIAYYVTLSILPLDIMTRSPFGRSVIYKFFFRILFQC